MVSRGGGTKSSDILSKIDFREFTEAVVRLLLKLATNDLHVWRGFETVSTLPACILQRASVICVAESVRTEAAPLMSSANPSVNGGSEAGECTR